MQLIAVLDWKPPDAEVLIVPKTLASAHGAHALPGEPQKLSNCDSLTDFDA